MELSGKKTSSHLQHLTREMERMRQTVEDRDNDPRDAIQHLEQKLNQLVITLHPSSEPIEEVLDQYTDTLCNAQKKNIFRKATCYKIFPY